MIEAVTLPVDVEATVAKLIQLPPEQRIEISERLIASLPDELEEYWDREIARRIEEFEAGRTRSSPADEVVERLRRRIDEADSNQ